MNTKTSLQNKAAVVTGASKGIGAAIAKRLAAEGASVVVNYATSKSGADKVVKDITDAGGSAISIQADVSKKTDIERLFSETLEAYQRLDILVNNAGVYEFAPLEDVTEESFHRQFGINVLGLLLTTQEAVKHMPESGGSIINIGSVAGSAALPGSSVYGSTKASVDLITQILSKELGPRHIRVNTVNPGMVDTEGATEFYHSDWAKEVQAQTPLQRLGKPDDIAPAVAFLASDAASWITGEALPISGGHR